MSRRPTRSCVGSWRRRRRPSTACSQWQVRPGYSSGGSSDLDLAEEEKFGELDEISPVPSDSKHSDILTSLKEDFANEHGLTSKVVRLEVRPRCRRTAFIHFARLDSPNFFNCQGKF